MSATNFREGVWANVLLTGVAAVILGSICSSLSGLGNNELVLIVAGAVAAGLPLALARQRRKGVSLAKEMPYRTGA